MSALNVAESKADYFQQERQGSACFKEGTQLGVFLNKYIKS